MLFPTELRVLVSELCRGLFRAGREGDPIKIGLGGDTFSLRPSILRSLKGQRAILDGKIVVLDDKGRSSFPDLTAHRGEPRYYAFDLLCLNGRDLRALPLLERKRRLRRLVPTLALDGSRARPPACRRSWWVRVPGSLASFSYRQSQQLYLGHEDFERLDS